MPIFVFNFRRRQSEVFNSVGILDQISILRNPATADLKQNQYSTKMVQFGGSWLPRFTILLQKNGAIREAFRSSFSDIRPE
jgi:hypothetical protein